MAAITSTSQLIKRNAFANAMVITRREIKDSLRDWRILTPIAILTLVFPVLMDFTAGLAINWAAEYDATIVGERLIPFMLMIVGFFPISFSLVIALETFVGEKERNSIEPLLSTPISDLELYLGKMIAALFVPMMASFLGISVYLLGLYFTLGWLPSIFLLVQMLLLTSMKGLVMVSGAVVVSSQTTSVRAANLLASFIIIPMALLLQAEAFFLFWGMDDVIWFIIVALFVVDIILVRMGVRIFNREEILSREMDSLSLKSIWRDFRGYFLRSPVDAVNINLPTPAFSLKAVLRHDIPTLLRLHRLPMMVVIGMLIIASVGGILLAPYYPLPPGILDLDNVPNNRLDSVSMLPGLNVMGIFGHNVRALILSLVLSIFSFGSMALIIIMIPLGLVGYFAGAVSMLGHNPLTFVAAFILPHGFIEIPAAIIAATFTLRIGAALVSPPKSLDVGQGLLLTLADFFKIFIFLVIPMLFISAFIEATITPVIVTWIYGG